MTMGLVCLSPELLLQFFRFRRYPNILVMSVILASDPATLFLRCNLEAVVEII